MHVMLLSASVCVRFCFFFFQAEDGIRDYKVTGVQTCALPILFLARARLRMRGSAGQEGLRLTLADLVLDLSKKRVERAGRRLDLTRQEFAVLWLLLQRQGDVVTRAELVQQRSEERRVGEEGRSRW